ncbi:MAG: hypothetical protein HN352_02780 [Bacteroidetes bacterium]|nr:hypothetical protein [Bacteroidota bacterium]MBT3750308.1 hypothetical protein [Bacteroidota bacterium]MBT4399800.1 hypothetical protein [Bacteroidota bacterium]MBT5426353.1 hypothetical protein [Bacteroidota bacterium]MBT7464861.1 hypothetical protein [Bacteroidota bacterium]
MVIKYRYGVIILMCILYTSVLNAQGIFERSLNNTENALKSGPELSGFIRGVSYMNVSNGEAYTNATYSSLGLRISSTLGKYGKAFADLRFKSGQQFGESLSLLDVKEAWAAFYLNRLSITMGKQIIAWGRADGFNPTNHLGSQDYFFLSPDHDDLRLGSFMLRSTWNPIDPLSVEVILVPGYQASNYRFDLIAMPEYVQIQNNMAPIVKLSEGSIALKADYRGRVLEGAISYFRGYDHLPGLRIAEVAAPPFDPFFLRLATAPYRQQSFGADGAITLGKTIVRTELSLKMPLTEGSQLSNLPHKELNMVVGIEPSLGSLHIIAQYIGKYIPQFTLPDDIQEMNPEALADPANWPYLAGMLNQNISFYNQILFEQQHEYYHSGMINCSVDFFQQRLSANITALYNFTTDEYMLNPAFHYKPGDQLSIKLGYQYFTGPVNTRFHWIKDLFSGPYAEIRISF